MCGICGILDFEGREISTSMVKEMTDALIHRGPDEGGVYFSSQFKVHSSRWTPKVALGHRRLSIIDLTTGSQPMKNEDGSVVVVYNGEIYNYKTMSYELRAKGHIFKTTSDTEVILHQYEEEGWEGVKRFNGIFAYALWDDMANRLVLARDRVGIKPLFYTIDNGRLIFASEIKAILKALGKKPELDYQALFRYLILQYIPAPQTIFKGIFKLSPGTVMICDEKEIRQEVYWRPGINAKGQGARSKGQENEKEIQRQLIDLLDKSVEGQLVSDVPVGAFLSGGIDSSVIVGLMSKKMAEPVRTFSVGFETEDSYYNELQYARITARHFNTDHHELIVKPKDIIEVLPIVVGHLDDPINDPAVIPTYMVSKLARDYVRVVLTGEGADELFGGYLRYQLESLVRSYSVLSIFARTGLIKRGLNGIIKNRRFLQGIEAISASDEIERHLKWVSVFNLKDIMELIEGSIIDINTEWERLRESFGPHISDFNTIFMTDLCTWLPDDLLVKVDRMSMAVSLEARVPYLDDRMIDFALGLPVSLKVRDWKRKYIFKKTISNILPREIINRPKRGFDVPLPSWFRVELKEYIMDTLSTDKIKALGCLNAGKITTLIEEHLEGEKDNSLQIWGLLVLRAWWEEIDKWCRPI